MTAISLDDFKNKYILLGSVKKGIFTLKKSTVMIKLVIYILINIHHHKKSEDEYDD
jgi:hypothetical protein